MIKKRVLVTGGAGFIGSHLTELLLNEGHHVTVLDNLSNGKITNLNFACENRDFQFIQADIRNPSELVNVFSSIDWVFHLAGLCGVTQSLDQPRNYFDTNVSGTFNVLHESYRAGVKRFVYAASSSCYGLGSPDPISEDAPISPQNPYALTKYLAEQLVLHWAHVYQFPALSLRLFNVYGPRLSSDSVYGAVIPIFLGQKMREEPFTVFGDGEQTRDFTYVTDVANAFHTAAKSELVNHVFNVASASSHSINCLVDLLKGPAIYFPKRQGESDFSCANVGKIRQMLGWESKISFEEGIDYLLKLSDTQKKVVPTQLHSSQFSPILKEPCLLA